MLLAHRSEQLRKEGGQLVRIERLGEKRLGCRQAMRAGGLR